MKVVSTNIGIAQSVIINNVKQRTGIYKNPTNNPIFLGKTHVQEDEISNKKVHGGTFKACYLFSAESYDHWGNLYPYITWDFGMLGENLTILGLNEAQINVGDIYKVGSALIQITQPREPCATLAAKIGSPKIIKQFIEHCKPGMYARVLETGFVTVGDALALVKKASSSISIRDFFTLLFEKEKNQQHLKRLVNNDAISLKKRQQLMRFLI
ncbi:MOSC domain-containing protein [Flavobacteriaceae bacterium]|jgi:MOSC domain-containing protein YiiM|nr:MOSC domain-containing protein [Flavobacteriaceae bacterium]